ncbi:MAG TPA: SDR family NAD(P)-dependent oxidoreductase, partial [Vicinamibacterales bacterium]|nr:SDR family NAD(P)-dependent oxidoreductase [Vicinamibacterales bacterium]
ATEIDDGRIVGDVVLVDDSGSALMEVTGLEARRIQKIDSLIEILWQPLTNPRPIEGARWAATSPQLAAALPELHDNPTDILTDASDAAALLALAQSSPDARVWVITRNAQAVHSQDRVDPSDAWAWGLGKVVSLESPRSRWTTVDIEDDLAPLLQQCGGTHEREIAIRGGACWVPRLWRATITTVDKPLFRDDAAYLVTGAFGAIGRQLTRWMIDSGARRLVLVGRGVGEAPEGANAITVACDVADSDAVARLFASMPPIRGIFHAAGTLDAALLADLTTERFERVLRPKVDGTRNLHHHSLALELDHFVCFSSAASAFPASRSTGACGRGRGWGSVSAPPASIPFHRPARSSSSAASCAAIARSSASSPPTGRRCCRRGSTIRRRCSQTSRAPRVS